MLRNRRNSCPLLPKCHEGFSRRLYQVELVDSATFVFLRLKATRFRRCMRPELAGNTALAIIIQGYIFKVSFACLLGMCFSLIALSPVSGHWTIMRLVSLAGLLCSITTLAAAVDKPLVGDPAWPAWNRANMARTRDQYCADCMIICPDPYKDLGPREDFWTRGIRESLVRILRC